jgi:two-component system chemotaxis sensor kinase CheA
MMSDEFSAEPMLDVFLFETTQLLEQLEQSVMNSEKCDGYDQAEIDEVFRIMHSIKGAAAMMEFDNMAQLAHGIEDVFFYLRESHPDSVDCQQLSDLILASGDFIKTELEKLRNGSNADGDASLLIEATKVFLASLKSSNPEEQQATTQVDPIQRGQAYMATIFFQDNCGMENIRAYTVVPALQAIAEDITYIPADIMEDDSTADTIRKNGFKLFFSSVAAKNEINELLEKTIFLKKFELEEKAEEADK